MSANSAPNTQKSGWFGQLRARLIAVPRRVWIGLLVGSVVLHVIAVGFVLLLLFGGERGSGAEQDSVVISAGEAGP